MPLLILRRVLHVSLSREIEQHQDCEDEQTVCWVSHSFRIDDGDNLIFQMFTVEFAGDLACLANQSQFFRVFHRK